MLRASRCSATRRFALTLVLTATIALPVCSRAAAAGPMTAAERMRAYKALQIRTLAEGARAEMRERAERLREAARAARARAKTPRRLRGDRAKPSVEEREERSAAFQRAVEAYRQQKADAAQATTVIPTNVRANNPTGDGANAGQAEQAIASLGANVLIAWNDGQGFITGPDVQGYGFSTDGGQTFTDGGVPPKLTGWTWSSDPSVTVNEKTGEFWYCGLIDIAPNSGGIGIVKGTFSGSTFNWGTPVVVRSVPAASELLDKEWVVADSSSGNLYLAYTDFNPSSRIVFQRSTNGGTTWSGTQLLSAAAVNGLVSGARPVVRGTGELYVTWKEIGPVDVDFMRIRTSTDHGVSFLGTTATPNTIASFFDNFGTGAPGFNRERGITFPSINADRTFGPNRGRIYATWNESLNYFDDDLTPTSAKVEIENNNFFARATPFTIGQELRGAFGNTTDLDVFSFPATQGTSYIFFCDSIPKPLYSMRVFCTADTLTRLAFSGDITAPAGGQGVIVWTAPTSATYYLRMAFQNLTGSSIGGYHIFTGIAATGPERGRDQRDVFVATSDDGATWATPVRVNDEAALYDDWLPEVAVGADGMPYTTWFDWRDDGCGGKSHQYLSRSTDGGATWVANQRITTAQSPWTITGSNIAPNQGDYSHMYASSNSVRVAWADGRDADANVYTTNVPVDFGLTACPANQNADPNTNLNLSWTVHNNLPLYANDYNYTLTSARSWPLPSPGSVTVSAASDGAINLSVAVPDTAAPGINALCLAVTNTKGLLLQQCCTNLNVQPTTGVGGDRPLAFGLRGSVPNPAIGFARVDYTLPQAGRVRLAVFGLGGERVRMLVNGERPAGLNSAGWDGRDEHGRGVAAGTYFVKLEGLGQTAVRRMVWMR